MERWTLEKAKNGFSEVVRRALRHRPQLVTRGRSGDAVVVIARSDYDQLLARQNLVDFLRDSALAAMLATRDPGARIADPFARARDPGRRIDLESAPDA